ERLGRRGWPGRVAATRRVDARRRGPQAGAAPGGGESVQSRRMDAEPAAGRGLAGIALRRPRERAAPPAVLQRRAAAERLAQRRRRDRQYAANRRSADATPRPRRGGGRRSPLGARRLPCRARRLTGRAWQAGRGRSEPPLLHGTFAAADEEDELGRAVLHA